MGTSGLEPPTSRLSGVRSNHLSYAPIQNCGAILNIEFCFEVKDLNFASETAKHRLSILLLCNSCWCFSSYPSYPFGGDEEDRTPDPLLAKQVLSQLSYTPMCAKWCSSATSIHPPDKVGIQVSLCLCQDTNRPNNSVAHDYASHSRHLKSVPSKLNNNLRLTLV